MEIKERLRETVEEAKVLNRSLERRFVFSLVKNFFFALDIGFPAQRRQPFW